MTKFRPCIDLHQGKVKQIVGSSYSDSTENGLGELLVNHESSSSAAYFAQLYREDNLKGGHMILIGEKGSSENQAIEALRIYPFGLQIGGGVTIENAEKWLNYGASHVIVTSWLFDEAGSFKLSRLQQLVNHIGKKSIVLDLSCKCLDKNLSSWIVMKDHWQKPTNLVLNKDNLDELSEYCDEFLVHSASYEGKCQGIDKSLVEFLGKNSNISVTYAGGVKSLEDLDSVKELSGGKVDLAIGSALDIFGGTLIKYKDCVSWNNCNQIIT